MAGADTATNTQAAQSPGRYLQPLKHMHDIINKYVKSDFGDIEVPIDEEEKLKLAKALFGFSIISSLDYWLDNAKDIINNENPKELYTRDNEFSRKDKHFRETFAKLDNQTKEIVGRLIDTTATGILFSLLTNFDQFDFGKLIVSLKTKSLHKTEIQISSDKEDLHDELAEWIYVFSKFRDNLVEKSEDITGTSYRLK